jgi:uncharacterized protein YlzI (FlbEa/FlbD family)
MNTKLAKIDRLLAAGNVAHLVEPSKDPRLVDDEIRITPDIHIQVGEGYLMVVRNQPEETMQFTPTTERRLLATLHDVQQSASAPAE